MRRERRLRQQHPGRLAQHLHLGFLWLGLAGLFPRKYRGWDITDTHACARHRLQFWIHGRLQWRRLRADLQYVGFDTAPGGFTLPFGA